MKIVVNINKKYFFGILVAMFLLIGVLVAFAYDSTFKSDDVSPSVAGHSADEVNVKLPGVSNPMSLQEAIDKGYLGGRSGFKHYIESTDDKTLNQYGTYNGFAYIIPHDYGSPPSFIRATLVSLCNDTLYGINDEISIEQIYDDTGSADDERPITTVWANSTAIGVSFNSLNEATYIQNKYGNVERLYVWWSFTQEPCWKIRVRAAWV